MQIDELCTTDRSLCNIVASVQRQTAKVVHDEAFDVHDVHDFSDALHSEGACGRREDAFRCTLHLNR